VRVGFLINPIAGMGGAVGLKGTDRPEILEEAVRRGAVPLAENKAMEALKAAAPFQGYEFLAPKGRMGGNLLKMMDIDYRVVYEPSDPTTEEDTKEAGRRFLQEGAEIILFVGGDGTARDLMDAIDEKVPVIGIPAGVKMHSAVFATTPRNAGILLRRFRVDGIPAHRAEVMDIDEDEFRSGRLSAHLYGYMLTPSEPSLVQSIKMAIGGASEEEQKEAIADFFVEKMEPDTLYILGPGTTVEAVARKLGVPKTLLGVDAVLNGQLLAGDASESDLLSLLRENTRARIVVSPIGAQGFVFGRGNQQISPIIIKLVGLRNIVILASPTKLRKTEVLRVDTGDAQLDDELRGYTKVIIGYGLQRVVPIS